VWLVVAKTTQRTAPAWWIWYERRFRQHAALDTHRNSPIFTSEIACSTVDFLFLPHYTALW